MLDYSAAAYSRVLAQRTLNSARYAHASTVSAWRASAEMARNARVAFENGEPGSAAPSLEMTAAEAAPMPAAPPELSYLEAARPEVPPPPLVPFRLLADQVCSECSCPYIESSPSCRDVVTGAAHQQQSAQNLDLLVATLGEEAMHAFGDSDRESSSTQAGAASTDAVESLAHSLAQIAARNATKAYLGREGVSASSIAEALSSPGPSYDARSQAAAARQGVGAWGFAPVTAIVYDERMLLHEEMSRPEGRSRSNGLASILPGVELPPSPAGLHPERPDRLRAIAMHLVAAGLFNRCVRIPAREVTRAELRGVHHDRFLDKVDALPADVAAGGGRFVFDGGDTFANTGTYLAARLAAGSVCAVTEVVLSGLADRGLALVRPPGHHAEPDASLGFCIYNNVAVAAKAAIESYGAKRVMIVDWDVHHGNGALNCIRVLCSLLSTNPFHYSSLPPNLAFEGTENMFYEDPRVLYVSIHRYDNTNFFPGTGHPSRIGAGAGLGYNVNIGWPCGGAGDAEYIAAFDAIVCPLADAFSPDVVLVSAGFDAARGDPLGGCDVTPAGYAHMTHRLLGASAGRVVVALEGGYNLSSISKSAEAVLATLLGAPPPRLFDVPDRVHNLPSKSAAGLGLSGDAATAYDQLVAGPGREASESSDDASSSDSFVGMNRTQILAALSPASAALGAIEETLSHIKEFWPSLRSSKSRTGAFATMHADGSSDDQEASSNDDEGEDADAEAPFVASGAADGGDERRSGGQPILARCIKPSAAPKTQRDGDESIDEIEDSGDSGQGRQDAKRSRPGD